MKKGKCVTGAAAVKAGAALSGLVCSLPALSALSNPNLYNDLPDIMHVAKQAEHAVDVYYESIKGDNTLNDELLAMHLSGFGLWVPHKHAHIEPLTLPVESFIYHDGHPALETKYWPVHEIEDYLVSHTNMRLVSKS